MFALPVVIGLCHAPVHVVEEALTATARATYFETSPQQAVLWRKRQRPWKRPQNHDEWFAKNGLDPGAEEYSPQKKPRTAAEAPNDTVVSASQQ
eukprot:3602228-Pyramimonas_sp.AAC.1